MATRNRSRRGHMDPPASAPHFAPTRGSTRRSSRQTAASNLADPVSTPQGLRHPSEVSRHTGPATIPIARRGAPAGRYAKSIASMSTVLLRGDESPLGEEDRESEGPSPPASAPEVSEEELTKRKIMELTLPDLEYATIELMRRLEHVNLDDPVLRRLLQIKMEAFSSVRESFEEDKTSPLIDWVQAYEIWVDEEFTKAVNIMVRANIATALLETISLGAGEQTDPILLLDKINTCFPQLFISSVEMFQEPELLLDIRTRYLIESLDGLDGKLDETYELIASVFCEPSEGRDYAQRFASGPFKGLGSTSEERLAELVSERITKILPIIKKDRKKFGVHRLRQIFPMEELLAKFKTWLLETYALLESESQNLTDQASGLKESIHLVGEIEDSQTDGASQSQPIVRAVSGEIEPSLFVDELSLQYVNSKGQNKRSVPPSNQQQIMPPPGAPRDYTEHTNDNLLYSPAPASVYKLGKRQPEAPPSVRRKIRDPFETISEEEDDDEEDPFETDTRPVDKGKRAAIVSAMPEAKRRQTAEFESHQPAPDGDNSPSGSMPPPSSRLSQPPDPSQPSQADFETIKLAKRQIISQQARAQQARAQYAPASRQRHVWSHQDCLLLLQLIRERHAAWSTIERNDGDKFEHPRNQQAYRDKARNMKVDYLITDAILPPCFDLVALGKKEIERLISLGKNPYRKESDISADGQAINTEFTGGVDE